MSQTQHAPLLGQGQAETKRRAAAEPVTVTRHISKGEKWLWASAGVVVFFLALMMVINQTRIFMASKDTAILQSRLDSQSKTTQQLQADADSLSSPERIVSFAEKQLGLKLDIKNIKVLP
ncbi:MULTISPECIES: cell division protein FtsL [unclassified Sporolactobacillus]|uniref:cell division protein FtsL n=1 Tax=unclassified Sporolactobacillus TaxID=2628533 RepID=UPI002367B715|nr:cell division protein FtsL [Sporolactobacillus sp. CQH2019]MDD9147163.1 cell division protein FtsL [Sporolactobacillus sp. CQH2019]